MTRLMSDVRMPSGMNAATTITSGKNDTNAFPASATLRSMNSTSSIRSHTRHTSSRSNRVRRAAMRVRLSLLPVHGRGRLVRRRRLRAARARPCALAISLSISASRSPQVVCTTFVLSAPASSGSMSVPTLLTATTIRPDCPDSSSSAMASTSFFGMLWWKCPTSAPAPAPATTPTPGATTASAAPTHPRCLAVVSCRSTCSLPESSLVSTATAV